MLPSQGKTQDAPKPDFTGRVSALSSDASEITLQMQSEKSAGAKPTVIFKMDGATKVSFVGVPFYAEKPSVGYWAEVWMSPSSIQIAATVRFTGNLKKELADLIGRVVAIAPDGEQFTLRLPPANGDPTPLVTVKLSTGTQFQFGMLPNQMQKPAVGQVAAVWLEKGTKDLAAGIRLGGPVKKPPEVDSFFALPEGIELTPRQQIEVDALISRLTPAHAELLQKRSAILTPKQLAAAAKAEKNVREEGVTDPEQIQIARDAAMLTTPRQKARQEAIARREVELRQYFLERLSFLLNEEQKRKLPRPDPPAKK